MKPENVSKVIYLKIRTMPTSLSREQMQELIQARVSGVSELSEVAGVSESMLRSWHIVQAVRELLEKDTDGSIILTLMDLMEGK